MPTPEIIENAIYTTEELSELFGISYRNICLLIKRGHIKGAKIGKNWFVTGRSLLKVLEEGNDSHSKEDDFPVESEEENINNENTEG
ncbi:MAG: helix-turn-helix domain-containing protein [Chlamydiia bacterium]|nr:helix-turn-helix domain-containing protein [Chlamydiia bacterium]MCB9092763.1 helix-turn-helix domain-containing protein [Halobacteriovoraceae bacterium]